VSNYQCDNCCSPPGCSTTTTNGGQSEAVSDWRDSAIIVVVVTLFYVGVYFVVNKFKKKIQNMNILKKQQIQSIVGIFQKNWEF